MVASNLNEFSRELSEIMPLMVREFARREDNDLMRGKISCPQMVTLEYVCRRPCATMTEVANLLGTKTSSASVLVDRLIRQRMLSKSRDKADRRVVWVSVTPKGRKVVGQIMDQKRRSIREIFAPLTDGERQQYLSVLKKLKNHFDGNARA